MSTFRERYGNGPTTWPLSARVVLTVVVVFFPLNMWLAVLLEHTENAAFYLLLAGMSSMVAWPILRWTWTRTDSSLKQDWHVERELREGLERDQKVEDAAQLGVHDRDVPQRW